MFSSIILSTLVRYPCLLRLAAALTTGRGEGGKFTLSNNPMDLALVWMALVPMDFASGDRWTEFTEDEMILVFTGSRILTTG